MVTAPSFSSGSGAMVKCAVLPLTVRFRTWCSFLVRRSVKVTLRSPLVDRPFRRMNTLVLQFMGPNRGPTSCTTKLPKPGFWERIEEFVHRERFRIFLLSVMMLEYTTLSLSLRRCAFPSPKIRVNRSIDWYRRWLRIRSFVMPSSCLSLINSIWNLWITSKHN